MSEQAQMFREDMDRNLCKLSQCTGSTERTSVMLLFTELCALRHHNLKSKQTLSFM